MLAVQSGLFGLMGEGDIQSCSPQKGLIWARHEPTNSACTHGRSCKVNVRATVVTLDIKAFTECDRK